MRLLLLSLLLLLLFLIDSSALQEYATRFLLSKWVPSRVSVLTAVCESVQYTLVKEIGDSGGSGTGRVYSSLLDSAPTSGIRQSSLNAVVKQSWGHKIYLTFPPSTPAKAVFKECAMLKHLEEFDVENVPRCIASCYDKQADQQIILMQPLFVGSSATDVDPDTASIASMTTHSARAVATQKLATTVVQMLGRAHVVTTGRSDHSPSAIFAREPTTTTKTRTSSSTANTPSSSTESVHNSYYFKSEDDPEVQLLVNSDTGDILVIDFTESTELQLGDHDLFSKQDLELANAFVRSAASLVPEDCISEWRQVVRSALEQDTEVKNIHPQLREILITYAK